MQDALPACDERCGMLSLFQACAASFDPDESHTGRVSERVEDAYGITAASHAGYHQVGQASSLFYDLRARFDADHRLEIAYHTWIGMRSNHRADQVKGRFDVRYPVANCLVDG